MMRIEPLLEGGDWLWCIEIQKYYVFFYEVRKTIVMMNLNMNPDLEDMHIQEGNI